MNSKAPALSKCRLCGAESATLFKHLVLEKHMAVYRHCKACDHIFAEDPHWLAEAYSEAIVETDTDIAVRNVFTAIRLASLFYLGLGERGRGRYVDIAGGYGLLTRLMRDLGFNYFWSDPYARNLFARGFDCASAQGNCNAASAIEVLEHTVNPLAFLRDAMSLHGCDTLAFTTMTFPSGAPPQADEWDYYAFHSGQHIAFFSTQGLTTLASRLGLQYIQLDRIHLFTSRNIEPWKLRWASNKWLSVLLALLAVRRLGSRRNGDKTLLVKASRRAAPPA